MYYFTGSNLFGQWFRRDNNIIDEFTNLSENNQVHDTFDLKNVTLSHICWSHNIYYCNKKYYIAGDYKNSGQFLEQINLPKDCTNTSNLTVVSDDYHLVIVNRDTCLLWLINLENKDVKMFNINTELPIEKGPKRPRLENHILKCVATNGLLMLMTSKSVYCGLIPSLIDTSHCVGEPIDIKCGNEHYMLLTSTGHLYTWGNGRRLQLGHGDCHILDTPTEVEALAGIKITKIAAGGWHSLALTEFGDLYAWGWNDMGQLGIKENCNTRAIKSYPVPKLVDIYDDSGNVVNIEIKDIACGSRHSALLLDDGSIWTTGENKYGQLGHSIIDNLSLNYFKKCCSFKSASGLMCGQWSTVVNVIKP